MTYALFIKILIQPAQQARDKLGGPSSPNGISATTKPALFIVRPAFKQSPLHQVCVRACNEKVSLCDERSIRKERLVCSAAFTLGVFLTKFPKNHSVEEPSLFNNWSLSDLL